MCIQDSLMTSLRLSRTSDLPVSICGMASLNIQFPYRTCTDQLWSHPDTSMFTQGSEMKSLKPRRIWDPWCNHRSHNQASQSSTTTIWETNSSQLAMACGIPIPMGTKLSIIVCLDQSQTTQWSPIKCQAQLPTIRALLSTTCLDR